MAEEMVINACYECKHKCSVPGNAHIRCEKPDMDMTGAAHGKRNGWFYYPLLFDPVWMTKKCNNYESTENTTSQPCSQSTA